MNPTKRSAEAVKLYATLAVRIDTLIADMGSAIASEVGQTLAAVNRLDQLDEANEPSDRRV